MRIDADGVFHAESAEDLVDLMKMAGQGGVQEGIQKGTVTMDDAALAAASVFMQPKDTFQTVGSLDDPFADDYGSGRTSPKQPAGKPTTRIDSLKSGAKGAGARLKMVPGEINANANKVVDAQLKALQSRIPQGPTMKGRIPINRMAGNILKSPITRSVMKWAPVAGTALAVGDVVLGDESVGNKAMDAALMGTGAVLGSAVPIVGTAIGATAGKMASDGLQWLFGDKKTPEQRKMEAALAALQVG